MKEYTCSQERFLKDTEKHTMEIVRNDGVNRHLRFKAPGTSCYWFDILTWGGVLCVNGDCGTYVFSRTSDMFEFFRSRNWTDKGPDVLDINPQYWAEKIQAAPKDRGVDQFSETQFTQAVKEYYDQHYAEEIAVEQDWVRTAQEDECPLEPKVVTLMEEQAATRAEVWDEIESDILCYASSNCENDAMTALNDFRHESESGKFVFYEDMERFYGCKEFTHGYIWNCYAVIWAIKQFDAMFPDLIKPCKE